MHLEYNLLGNLFGNWKFILTQVLIIAAQYGIVTYGADITQCTPLSLRDQVLCMCFAAGTFIAWIIMKILPRRYFAFNFVSHPP